MNRLWIALGALAGLGAVALSAWSAHGLPQMLEPAPLDAVRSAITLQGWHALALVATGLFAAQRGGILPQIAGAAFFLGMLMFCGAVYSANLAGIRLGPVAPVGGITLMLGWALLFLAAVKRA
ncbi:DUF423 domain-containing protein [Plastoroseomonas arctica]|uniref:DUF423 domain-containing protein n=1 Tax=Plastoroseomonas arctica TaxID=1509237 RepID=A0AAF1K5W3_9PROT|nr:DUF423 domain-containing protein [Plastoroseomonas arctica]MBR0657020.1 DUF423 domain-containing protein [Plastoroseomonas arctica]